ncbi:hypothetical protein [Psychrobacter sp. FDAARGOS_221]|uniref:hypothetical protein n=1 Tax=Psychrobacter sp. FDAARGOS_221 TaxID=1975705 RepID=UPI000FD9EB69|nr:hypothetical protein [Psychrobacter sp. FDAARGOS_221]
MIFISAIRRELSFIPKLFITETYLILGRSYYWWEDVFLISIALIALAFLVLSWRYLWGFLKITPKALYVSVTSLVFTQYLGENGIGFSHDAGVMVEEISEATIYLIDFLYLWRFKLSEFEYNLSPDHVKNPAVHSSSYSDAQSEVSEDELEYKSPKSC